MEIELPDQGCNVYYGTYIDNYNGNVRTRFYLNENQLIPSSTSSYTRLPDGVQCLDSSTSIVYKPESHVYFEFMAIIGTLFILFSAVRLILYRFWRKI